MRTRLRSSIRRSITTQFRCEVGQRRVQGGGRVREVAEGVEKGEKERTGSDLRARTEQHGLLDYARCLSSRHAESTFADLQTALPPELFSYTPYTPARAALGSCTNTVSLTGQKGSVGSGNSNNLHRMRKALLRQHFLVQRVEEISILLNGLARAVPDFFSHITALCLRGHVKGVGKRVMGLPPCSRAQTQARRLLCSWALHIRP